MRTQKKVEAILSLPDPKSTRDIMRLTGRMAALTQFRSKSADKALPFYYNRKSSKEKVGGERAGSVCSGEGTFKETTYNDQSRSRRKTPALRLSITADGSSSSAG